VVEELDVDEIDSERTPRYLIGKECIPDVFESVGKR